MPESFLGHKDLQGTKQSSCSHRDLMHVYFGTCCKNIEIADSKKKKKKEGVKE